MKKFTLYVGLFDKDTKRQEVNTISAFKIATNIFLQNVGGVTITESQGIYTHENGEIVIEPTLRCEVFGIEKETVKAISQQLKVALNQESILIEKAEIESDFF